MNTRQVFPIMIVLLGTVAANGCSVGPGPSSTSFGGDYGDESIRIFVTNLNFMDATLWAVTTGTREKLGIVTGKRDAVYTLPWKGYTDLRIEIDILSGPRCVTESLPVDPGDDIELIINVEMLNSPLCKWSPVPVP
ncbi:MAG: hypothetical protein ACQET1_00925 [Gemmatimonadota bacterium]